ncbi:hypothetical protein ILYODFUR_036831 [Ilyodon furcidens]|uniref:Secreted protein n=1 Tax=Ilyodon furcidens TaxID=33524 RepID=A0ABV0V970_9TELE
MFFMSFIANSTQAAMEWLPSGHYAIQVSSVDCCRDVFFLKCSVSTQQHWISERVTIRILVTFLTKALLPRSPSLDNRPAVGRVPVVPNLFHIFDVGGHCVP